MFRIALLLVSCLMMSSGTATADQKIRLMANTSPPYADANLPEQGLALELVNHIFSRTDYSPEISIERWSRAMEGVRVGLFDALATAWYTEERSVDFLFSDPYLDSKLVLVKRQSDRSRYRSLQDLAGKRLGVRVDYAYGVDFNSVPQLKLVEENHLIQNLLNLLNGSVDLVIGDQRTMNLQLQEYLKDRVNQFEVVHLNLPVRQRHVAAGRDVAGHKEMISAFNKALTEVRKDGSYAAIVKKWDQRYAMPQ